MAGPLPRRGLDHLGVGAELHEERGARRASELRVPDLVGGALGARLHAHEEVADAGEGRSLETPLHDDLIAARQGLARGRGGA